MYLITTMQGLRSTLNLKIGTKLLQWNIILLQKWLPCLLYPAIHWRPIQFVPFLSSCRRAAIDASPPAALDFFLSIHPSIHFFWAVKLCIGYYCCLTAGKSWVQIHHPTRASLRAFPVSVMNGSFSFQTEIRAVYKYQIYLFITA